MSEPDRDEQEPREPSPGTPQWATLAASLGAVSLLAAASPLVLASRAAEPMLPPNPLAPLVATAPPEGPLFETPTADLRAPRPGVSGPFAQGLPIPQTTAAGAPAEAGRGHVGSGAGHIGPLGPMGPLSAQVAINGPVRGPQWTRNALPNVAGIPGTALAASDGLPAGVRPATSEYSSELPNDQRVELSRLANPEAAVRAAAAGHTAGQATAEKPLRLFLSLNRPVGGYRAGETVTVRVSSSTDCYAALIRVDPTGKANVVFRSPGPSRGFACALRTGPAAGAEYVVAVGSVYPLDGADAAAALKASGGFPPAIPAVENGTAPAAAWSQAVAQAAALGGGAKPWQKFEWAVDAASFGTHVPVRVAETRPARGPAGKAPGDSSAIPAEGSKPEEKPENGDSKAPSGDGKTVRPAPDPGKEPSVMPMPATAPASSGSDRSVLPPTIRQTK